MRKIEIAADEVLSETAVRELLTGSRDRLLLRQWDSIVKHCLCSDGEVYAPDGTLVAGLIKGCIPKAALDTAWPALSQVKGDPSNRPLIVGRGARQPRIRVTDGNLSRRVGVPHALLKELKKRGGATDILGYYDYRDEHDRTKLVCRPSNWTLERPDIYKASLPLIFAVDRAYRKYLPEQHARQLAEVAKVPASLRIGDTSFTTVYVIKNVETAIHRDAGDVETGKGFGVMTAWGEYRGNQFCIPQFRVAVDYRPGDLLLADVHQLHGNFPLISGTRIACVFHVRQGLLPETP